MSIAAPPAPPSKRLVQYRRPPLYPKQEEALFSPARYSIVEASTKSGKTVGCIVWLHEKAALEGGPGKNYWWIAPILRTSRIAYRRLKNYLPRGSYKANETAMTITLLNGAVIHFLGAENPDSLYGEDVYAAVIDEATRVKADSWYAIRSTLTATGGPVRIIGNVKGRRNWAYKLARTAEAGKVDYHYAKLTVWDAVEAGIFPKSEAEDAREILPAAVFAELYLAEAAEEDEQFFQIDKISIVKGIPDHARLARGWDFAITDPTKKPDADPDYTVGAKLGMADRMTYIVDVVRFRAAPDKVTSTVKSTAIADGRSCAQVLEQEQGSAGGIMVEQFAQLLRGTGAGRVYPSPVSGGKIVRAFHLSAAVNDKRVALVEGDWNDAYLEELDEFPPLEGQHDDQVDGSAHAYNYLAPNVKGGFRWLD